MIVEEMMKTDLVTLTPDHTIAEAMKLLDTHKIRHIPIVNDLHYVVGIISDRDVRDASPSILDSNYTSALLSEPVRMIMLKKLQVFFMNIKSVVFPSQKTSG
jgi:acetoin utilization protein AcuB